MQGPCTGAGLTMTREGWTERNPQTCPSQTQWILVTALEPAAGLCLHFCRKTIKKLSNSDSTK